MKISSEITVETEFKPEERLDMAAASRPAITKPDIPTGNPNNINLGNKVSDCSLKDWPSAKKCWFLEKKANIASPKRPRRHLANKLVYKETFKDFLAALMSLVDKYL